MLETSLITIFVRRMKIVIEEMYCLESVKMTQRIWRRFFEEEKLFVFLLGYVNQLTLSRCILVKKTFDAVV
jgi:hypothetical protein